MPSDLRLQRALEALGDRRAGFRAAVETAYAQSRAFLAAHAPRADARAHETALELGPFAGGRVDAARFAALVTAARVLGPDEETVVRRCGEVMDEVLAQGDGLFVCDVPPGGDFHAEVDAALAEVGRAFGAAYAFQAVRAGSYRPERHAAALRAFPFRRWSRGERLLAPPLVVTADGADVHAGSLAEYLDGRQKVVLVVRGATPPAPLARLVAPRTYVAQLFDADVDAGGLARAMAYDGPAVVALVPETAARFVHDPTAGAALAQRLTVVALPKEPPRVAVGGHSVAQQREELALLVERAELAGTQLSAVGSRLSAIHGSHPERSEGSPDSSAHRPMPGRAGDPSVAPAALAQDDSVRTVAESREPIAESGPSAVDALTTWLLAQAGFPSRDGLATVAGGPKG